MRRLCVGGAAVAVLLVAQSVGAEPGPSVTQSNFDCTGTAPDMFFPETVDVSGHIAFVAQDQTNQACASQRLEDQLNNPAYLQKMQEVAPGSYLELQQSQSGELSRPRITGAQMIPGAAVGDPFRTKHEWANVLQRGRVIPISYITTRWMARHVSGGEGSKVYGDIWLPPASVTGPYPGVIISTGGSQQFRQLYHWLAQGLAEAGYMVMTYDFQGQGQSESFAHHRDGSICISAGCGRATIPAELSYNYGAVYEQLKDAITFFHSTSSSPYSSPVLGANYVGTDRFNPAWELLDTSEVGLVGHSIGAIAATEAGQEDTRIRAIVRYGFTGRIGEQGNNGIVSDALKAAHAPTLIIESEYDGGPQPWNLQRHPGVPEIGYNQIVGLEPRIDAMQVVLRSSTHYEWTYVTGREASRLGERVSFYYTLAWLDTYLKGTDDDDVRLDGFRRLSAQVFDGSADAHSIGAGTYRYDPVTGKFVNVPHKIEGLRVRDRLSYMYWSMYKLQGGGLACQNMRRADCVRGSLP